MQEPKKTTPHELFTQSNAYVAPVFQRYYVWGERELSSLIADIDKAIDRNADKDDDDLEESFLGAIVLQDLGKKTGPTSVHEYLIIDGQQRLTTIYMLLAGIAELAHKKHLVDRAREIATAYLSYSADGPHKGEPRLVPTLQDRRALWNILADDVPLAPWNFARWGADESPQGLIPQQQQRIRQTLEERFIADDKAIRQEQLSRFLAATLDALTFVCITLDKGDDANEVFSKLNAEGQELSLADLVRNDVFARFSGKDTAEAGRFNTDYWQPFEKRFPKKKSKKGVVQGDALGSYFYPFAIIRFEGNVTQREAFPKLREAWKHAESKAMLEELERYAPFFCALHDYRTLEGLSSEVDELVYRFSRMPRTTVTWPFVIQALEATAAGKLAPSSAEKSLLILESFLVRRALVGWEPTGLHAVFKSLWHRTAGEPSGVFSKILTKTIKYPEDKELRRILVSKSSDTRHMLPYVLQEREIEWREEAGADPLPLEALRKQTIEHVMPQYLAPEWAKVVRRKDHERAVGLLGNLLPLSDRQNKQAQAKPWRDKRAKFAGSHWLQTQDASKAPEWTVELIQERTEAFTGWILKRWPELDQFA